MDRPRDTACLNGLRFFGKISASISHELKNALAVISESAGLAEDLLYAAESGLPIDEARLKKSCQRIRARVEGADGILKNMNAFAHSIDEPMRQADIIAIVDLAVALTKRLLDMQGVSLKMELPPAPVILHTSPFFLKNIIWLLLEFAMENRGGLETLYMAVKKTETGVEICFSGFDGFDEKSQSDFPTESMQSLLDVLKAEMECNIEKRELILKLHDLLGSY